MDWTDTGYDSTVTVAVVHQTNVDNSLGVLTGVTLDSVRVTEEYYSDSRAQAKVTTVVKEGQSDGYVDNARLRIILAVPSQNWSKELFTGFVTEIDEKTTSGWTTREYSLDSSLWGILEHKVDSAVVVGKGAKLINIWTSLVSKKTKLQYSTTGAQDHVYTANTVYEPGTDLATILFELSSGYSRVDVDGHGRLTLKKYTAPSKLAPVATLNPKDPKGLIFGDLSRNDSRYDTPGHAMVVATVTNDNDQQETIVGSYYPAASHASSIQTRGWLRSSSESYSGASEKPSKSELNALAKRNWENNQDLGIEWTASSIYADIHAGECYTLVKPDGKSVKVLAKSVESRFDEMVQELTLKEV